MNLLVQVALVVEVTSLFAGGTWELVSSFELIDHCTEILLQGVLQFFMIFDGLGSGVGCVFECLGCGMGRVIVVSSI